MIIGNLKVSHENVEHSPLVIRKVLEFLRNIDFEKLENKRYDILDNKLFLIMNAYQTRDISEKKAEQHKKYIDVQYIVSGVENIGFGFENKDNVVISDYDEAKDGKFFKTVQDETFITLKQGMFAIFFPSDIHRPELDVNNEKQNVRKCVVKIDVDLLNEKDIKELKFKT